MLLNVNGTWDSQWLRKRVSKFQLVWDKQASDSMCRDIRDPRVPYVEEPLMWTFKKKLFVQTSVTCQNVLSFPYEALLHRVTVWLTVQICLIHLLQQELKKRTNKATSILSKSAKSLRALRSLHFAWMCAQQKVFWCWYFSIQHVLLFW